MLAVLEPERELALEDEERLCVLRVDVQRRSYPARIGADLHDADLLDVRKESHSELSIAGDALAFADLDHEPAA